MPANVTVEYAKANEKYLNAKTREEKIAALEEMLSKIPKHKGTERMQAMLKQKLSKLKSQKEAKASRRTLSIPKEGSAQVCILGFTQSGKSTFLSNVTNARPKISDIPYTTKEPEVGTMDYEGVKIQLIEIPSTFKPVFMSLIHSSDGVVLIYRNEKEKDELKKILSDFRINKPFVEIERGEEMGESKKLIWGMLGLIRVYCKEPRKEPEKKPLVLKEGSTVEDAVKRLHKDFFKYFKFVRVWGSSKYPGERAGLEYKLRDGDIIEVHIS